MAYDYLNEAPAMSRDDFTKVFHDEEEASAFFAEQSTYDKWMDQVKTADCRVHLIDQNPLPIVWSNKDRSEQAIKDNALKDCSVDAVMDTMAENGTWAYMSIAGCGNYLIRNSAMDGIKFRAGQEGRATDAMYKRNRGEFYPRQINEGCEIMDASVQVLIRNEKITAFNSKNYQVMPADELYAELRSIMDDRFEDAFFEGGYYNHMMSEMRWSLPAQSEEMLKSYRQTLEAANNEAIKINSIVPLISFRTSDVGINCATVRAQVRVFPCDGKPSFVMDLGDAIRVEHRKPESVQSFAKKCKGLFAAYQDQTAKLAMLLNIKIDASNPGLSISGICQRFGLSPAIFRKASEEFEILGAEPTAHDVFWALCKGVAAYINEKKITGNNRVRLEESAARMLALSPQDWQDAEDAARQKAASLANKTKAAIDHDDDEEVA